MQESSFIPSMIEKINVKPDPFMKALEQHSLVLSPISVETLQVSLGKLCNQACRHCHVDASPSRTEMMDQRTIDQCLEILASEPGIKNLDLTGGAPELNPNFDYFVEEARKLMKHVIVRHNLTVTFDGNPKTGETKSYLPDFFAQHEVEVISSLPYHQVYYTDKQRGKDVFKKSIESLRLLNARGYGQSTGLQLHLVHNPVGAFLPANQTNLEADFKRELLSRHGVVFNNLFTMANMPIHRFRESLVRSSTLEDYMNKLIAAFNPAAAHNVMCRSMLSVGYDGKIYDCDFNQMLELQIDGSPPATVSNFNTHRLLNRKIIFASHCFGCTAGAGSSCGGAIV